MVDPDVYNRGRNPSTADALEHSFTDICAKLHDLWATEMVWTRFEDLDRWYAEETGRGSIIERRDSSASTMGSHPFSAAWINDFHAMNADLVEQFAYLAADEIRTCFDLAPDIDPAPLSQRCQLVTRPNAEVIGSHASNIAMSARTLHGFTSGLDRDDESMPGFVRRLQNNGWKEWSLSSDSFFEFYGDLSDLTGNYADALSVQATVAASVSRILSGYQKSLTDIAKGIQQQVTSALAYWQANKAPYTSTMTRTPQETGVSKVADLVATGADIVGLIPVAGAVADPVGLVAQIVAWGAQSFDVKIESTSVRPASGIYEDLTAGIDKVQEECLNALDALQSRAIEDGQSFQTYVKGSQDNGSWNPPDVDFG